jgi:hypothetical protein
MLFFSFSCLKYANVTIGFSANLPVTELKALCQTRGLQFAGAKATLVARPVESDRAEDTPGYVIILLSYTSNY